MDSTSPQSADIIAPPPVLYLGALLVGVIIQLASPLPVFDAPQVYYGLGALLFVVGGALARWSFVTLRRIGTTGNPSEPSSALAVHGPFRLSRNPIYLAMTAMYLGVSLLADTWWPLFLLVPLMLIMHWGVVLREERYLATQFGQSYLEFKAKVRRWL